MGSDTGAVEGAPALNTVDFISRHISLFKEGNQHVGICPFHDPTDGHWLKISGGAWRCGICGSHEIAGGDAIGFYACWTNSSREEAAAALGNGAGLPDAKPITQVPLKKLPFWGWRELDKLPGKAVWIHELSGSVLVWRELLPQRPHLGLIEGRSWDDLAIVAGRRCVLVPENNAASRVKMQRLAAALYRAGHAKVMRLDMGVHPEFGTRGMPEAGEDPLKWAAARSKPYPQPNAAPQDNKADTASLGAGVVAPSSGSLPNTSGPVGAAPEPPMTDEELENTLMAAAFPPEFRAAKTEEAKARVAQRRAQEAVAAPGDSTLAAPPEIAQLAPSWDGLNLILSAKGEVKPCEHNAKELMAAAKQYACLHFDKFLYRVRLGERDWSDADDRDAVVWLQSAHRVAGFTLNQARTAAMALAHARQHDSLFEFVMGLPKWDGVPRIETAFIDAWGAPDTSLSRAASRNFFIALHARAVKPGAQVDNLWAIEGPQGKLKSASLRALGEHFHAEITAQIGTADFLRELRGIWIAELSELDSLRGREASTVKRLLSAPSDRFVEKFEKHATAYPRRAVAVATTNEATYWQDSTGGRRLIPISIGEIRLDLIAENRLHWFAEARHEHQAGARWWQFPDTAMVEQEERQAIDPWEDMLRSYVANGRMDADGYAKPWPTEWIASAEIMSDWLKLPTSQQGKASGVRLGHIMRRLGFRPRRSSTGKERGWQQTDTQQASEYE